MMRYEKLSIPMVVNICFVVGALARGGIARSEERSFSPALVASSIENEAPASTSALSDEGALRDEFKLLETASLLSFPQVESVSRRIQSMEDSPESVTVLNQEEIQRSGAVNVAELLRRVPGVFVLQTLANEYSVGMRGINPLANTRVLFLVDGRPVATQQTGEVPYTALPYLEEIERIEVIRGPSSMGYGANAMSGVVNIILKKPLDHPGYEIDARGQLAIVRNEKATKTTADKTLVRDLWMQSGGDAFAAYNYVNEQKTFGFRLSAQMGANPDWTPPSKASNNVGTYHYNFSGGFDHRPASDWSIYGRLGHSSNRQIITIATATGYAYVGRESHFWGAVTVEKQHFIADPLTLKIDVDGGYKENYISIPLVLTSGATTVDIGSQIKQTMKSFDTHGVAFLDLNLFDGRTITSVGGELSYFQSMELPVEGRSIFGGLMINTMTKLLADSSLIIDVGARFDYLYLSNLESTSEAKYRRISPRAAVVWKFAQNQSIRFVAASSYRTPTVYSLFAEVKVPLLEPPLPAQMLARGNPFLVPEGLISQEIGYRGKLFDMVLVDAVVFHQRIDDIIRQYEGVTVPFYSVNSNSYDQIGAELGFNIIVSNKLSLYFNYTFLYSYNRDTKTEDKEWPMHLYGIGGEWRLPGRNRLCADLNLMFDYRPSNWVGIDLNDVQNTILALERHQAADQALLNVRFGHFFHNDSAELYLVIHNLVGFFRDPSGLRMMPYPSFPPLGGSILIGISVKGG